LISKTFSHLEKQMIDKPSKNGQKPAPIAPPTPVEQTPVEQTPVEKPQIAPPGRIRKPWPPVQGK
jgi:hypothetical protein